MLKIGFPHGLGVGGKWSGQLLHWAYPGLVLENLARLAWDFVPKILKIDFLAGLCPNMSMEIDTFDRRILREMQKDASVSMDALAEKVNLSRNACWRRVKAMEASGLIKARVAQLDPNALGLGLTVFVMIRAQTHEADWLEKFRKAVATLPEIQSAHRMSGDLDYVLRLRVADVPGYDLFYQRLIKQVPLGDVSASFVMEDLKDTTALPI